MLRHVGFEDLGSFEALLRNADFEITYVDAPSVDLSTVDGSEPELLVVLGGPIGAYQERDYPFLRAERALLERRLSEHGPTLGICLGSQLLAQALGARVYRGPRKEIGWAPLELTQEGRRGALSRLDGAHTPVLHWHGDTFDLPEGATLLASTPTYAHQAFSWGQAVLGLQFHVEVTARQLEAWYVGHAAELQLEGIAPEHLRVESEQYAPVLQSYAEPFLHAWLAAAGL
ncbi:MAG TPA: glutamine amidotransferase [Polyangiaceae bacterium]|nr:glutamine amidotransferase [Polyangiaceae bacterium]